MQLKLSHNLEFKDLYSRAGLVKLDAAFAEHLKTVNVELYNKFLAARASRPTDKKEESNLIIELAPVLEDFIAELFNIRAEVSKLQFRHNDLGNLYTTKRMFVQRAAAKYAKATDAVEDGNELAKVLGIDENDFERDYSNKVVMWMDENNTDKLTLAAKYVNWANSEAGQHKHKDGIIFKKPKKLDFANLVPLESEVVNGVTIQKLAHHEWRARDGFKLTDNGGTLAYALDQANYCIFCHNQGKDSCSKGMWDKLAEDGKKVVKKSPTQVNLAGCPLEEKISEMNTVKSSGFTIGALGVITIDNPMCAGTGHRICNDCMKSCIYQKQSPVDIPQVETRSLKDVLELPWGFEIYSLLTRWNPLNLDRPLPRPESGYNVLVAGLGPAGFTLAHHLMNDGHKVVGIDGLKIEPVDEDISGVDAHGKRYNFRPIHNINEIKESLDERTLAGFGGVAEYGITVRWDKNFLKIIRLLLERRAEFNMVGGVRFGSNITYDQAFEMGFDHIALCMGAGRPTVVEMKNGLARGVRTASDFLMALQLTGAAKKDSIANLTVRLPVVVIGGGLTAVDSTTESMAYYPIQVEKFLHRYEILVRELGEQAVRARWSEEEKETAEEFITHAKAFRAQKAANPNANPADLINQWGGVTLAYRKTLQDAPSYRLNHEEVELAFQEGIQFLGDCTPLEVITDKFGCAAQLKVKLGLEEKIIPARTIIMAAGTSPNTVAAREDTQHFELDGKYFRMIDEDGNIQKPEWLSKPSKANVLMSVNENGKAVSFFGDLHPDYAGNVVKAMGSAKQGYPVVTRALERAEPSGKVPDVNNELRASVHDVVRLTPNIIEVIVKAPLAARNFEPGQFYRLQNFEAYATVADDGTKLAMEGLALTGAWVDKEKGLMSTIVLEMGGSSDLCYHLTKGEPIILMGPTGTPTHIPANDTVMLVGGGLGNAVLFSIGKAMKAAGSKVLYFAGYKKPQDRYKIEEIEAASDVIIWACDEAADFKPNRPNDRFFTGNIVQAIVAYATGQLGEPVINTKDVNHIITIGSDRMMAAVKAARHGVLKPVLKHKHEAIGSINSPMQCMMKEICAQCLQRHVDPETGKETFVYSCFNQDQCLDAVDFVFLNDRLKQNGLQEKLTSLWIDRSLKILGMRNSQVA